MGHRRDHDHAQRGEDQGSHLRVLSRVEGHRGGGASRPHDGLHTPPSLGARTKCSAAERGGEVGWHLSEAPELSAHEQHVLDDVPISTPLGRIGAEMKAFSCWAAGLPHNVMTTSVRHSLHLLLLREYEY